MNTVTRKHSKIYKSTALIEISPLKLAVSEARITKSEIDRRLNFKLEKYFNLLLLEVLITKHNLFRNERANGIDIKPLAEKIYTRIEVETESVIDNKVTSFRLSYYDENTEEAEAVASALAEDLFNSQIQDNNLDKITIISQMKLPTSVIFPKRRLLTNVGLGIALFFIVFISCRQHNHLLKQ